MPNPPTAADAAPDTAADIRARYHAAPTFREYLDTVVENAELWKNTARLTQVSDEAVARAARLGRWHLLALSEDWCGDAVNTLPVVARLAERSPNLDFRVLGRDANPDLMDAHLSGGTSRAIPVVIAYDGDFVERGWWGSRPAALQAWVTGEGQALEKAERYRQVRTWYARDRGRTTVDEVLRLLETSAP